MYPPPEFTPTQFEVSQECVFIVEDIEYIAPVKFVWVWFV